MAITSLAMKETVIFASAATQTLWMGPRPPGAVLEEARDRFW